MKVGKMNTTMRNQALNVNTSNPLTMHKTAGHKAEGVGLAAVPVCYSACL